MDAADDGGLRECHAHPDPVERFRLALWGPVDAGTQAAARHAAGCRACREEIDLLREARDHVRAGADAPAATRVLDACFGPQDEGIDFAAAVAVPVAPLSGIRGNESPEHFRCESGGVTFDLLLHPAPLSSRPALSGQVLASAAATSPATADAADLRPLSDADVRVFLDREPAEGTRTDAFGEFVVPVERGRRIGLRVRAGGIVRHVELPPEAAGEGA